MKRVGYGVLFTIDEFCEALDSRFIIPFYDGYGYYAVGEIESEERVVSSVSSFVRRMANKKGYTGVIWYNK